MTWAARVSSYGDTQPVRDIRVGRRSIEGFTITGLIVEAVEADHCEYRKSKGIVLDCEALPHKSLVIYRSAGQMVHRAEIGQRLDVSSPCRSAFKKGPYECCQGLL